MHAHFKRLMATSVDLCLGAPEVVWKRVNRLSRPEAWATTEGPLEVARMITEKQIAWADAWWRVAGGLGGQWQTMWFDLARGKTPATPSPSQQMALTRAALLPFSDKVKANNRRLKTGTRRAK